MALTQKDVDDLKQIYEQEFRESLSDDEAWEMARRLLRFGELMLPCILKEQEKQQSQDSNRVSFD